MLSLVILAAISDCTVNNRKQQLICVEFSRLVAFLTAVKAFFRAARRTASGTSAGAGTGAGDTSTSTAVAAAAKSCGRQVGSVRVSVNHRSPDYGVI